MLCVCFRPSPVTMLVLIVTTLMWKEQLRRILVRKWKSWLSKELGMTSLFPFRLVSWAALTSSAWPECVAHPGVVQCVWLFYASWVYSHLVLFCDCRIPGQLGDAWSKETGHHCDPYFPLQCLHHRRITDITKQCVIMLSRRLWFKQ